MPGPLRTNISSIESANVRPIVVALHARTQFSGVSRGVLRPTSFAPALLCAIVSKGLRTLQRADRVETTLKKMTRYNASNEVLHGQANQQPPAAPAPSRAGRSSRRSVKIPAVWKKDSRPLTLTNQLWQNKEAA